MNARLMEMIFNVSYLIGIYYLVILMSQKLKNAAEGKDKKLLQLVRNAFLLLAAGDTGHVGFRVIAETVSGMKAVQSLFGVEFTMVGLGNLTTAFTVTIFYMLMLEIWRRRFGKNYSDVYYLLMGAGIFRLALFPFPGNQWGSSVPPFAWSLFRNIPLMIQGIGLAVLMLRDSQRTQDRPFYLMSLMIFMSYAFYLPVILLVQRMPMIGMLMIPKTCAYILIAVIAYRQLCSTAPEQYALRQEPAYEVGD